MKNKTTRAKIETQEPPSLKSGQRTPANSRPNQNIGNLGNISSANSVRTPSAIGDLSPKSQNPKFVFPVKPSQPPPLVAAAPTILQPSSPPKTDPWMFIEEQEKRVPGLNRITPGLQVPEETWAQVKAKFAKEKEITKIVDGKSLVT